MLTFEGEVISREMCVVAVVVQRLDQMIDAGLIQGPKRTTESGMRLVSHLNSVGFEFGPDEERHALQAVGFPNQEMYQKFEQALAERPSDTH